MFTGDVSIDDLDGNGLVPADDVGPLSQRIIVPLIRP
jgi:hypothetical protein